MNDRWDISRSKVFVLNRGSLVFLRFEAPEMRLEKPSKLSKGMYNQHRSLFAAFFYFVWIYDE